MDLFVKSIGHGPPLVMLHGCGLNHAVWLDLVPYLHKQYRLHLVDLPGHGKSKDIADYSLQHITAILQKRFDQPCSVLAWSLGAIIAMHWAAHDKQVRKLALVAGTAQFFQSHDWPNAIQPQVLDDFAVNLQTDYQKTLGRFLSLQSLGADNIRQQIRNLRSMVLHQGVPSQAALNGGLHILKTANLRPLLADIGCPVLLLQGEKDLLVPAVTANELVRLLPNARLIILNQASHAPFLSHPQHFLDEIMAFLSACR
mgnify:CR=1 FL=1